jgi:hypothetical protein
VALRPRAYSFNKSAQQILTDYTGILHIISSNHYIIEKETTTQKIEVSLRKQLSTTTQIKKMMTKTK